MALPFKLSDGVFFDLSDRTKLQLRGGDRLRFLNGQITNDVAKAISSTAIAACLLNAKGKMSAHVFISSGADFFVLDADASLRDSLQSRLEKYVIADDVEVEDVTEHWSIFHTLTEPPPDLPGEARVVSTNRFDQPGWDLWVRSAHRGEVFDQLSKSNEFCDAACAEVFRIEQGIPRWGRELTEEIIPVEANLEQSCIDYEKGCYIGQEVVSRMKMSGQRNKELCGFVALDNLPIDPATKLRLDGKEAGWITSSTRSQRLGKEIALGYAKRGFNAPGTRLSLGEANRFVTVVELPFRAIIGTD